MMGYWVAFARTGDPNGGGRPAWPRATADAERLLNFGNEGPAAIDIPFNGRLDILERFRARPRR
jgi:para-nitrobenzyl esterase